MKDKKAVLPGDIYGNLSDFHVYHFSWTYDFNHYLSLIKLGVDYMEKAAPASSALRVS